MLQNGDGECHGQALALLLDVLQRSAQVPPERHLLHGAAGRRVAVKLRHLLYLPRPPRKRFGQRVQKGRVFEPARQKSKANTKEQWANDSKPPARSETGLET